MTDRLELMAIAMFDSLYGDVHESSWADVGEDVRKLYRTMAPAAYAVAVGEADDESETCGNLGELLKRYAPARFTAQHITDQARMPTTGTIPTEQDLAVHRAVGQVNRR